MANIQAYPTGTPKVDDLLLGTSVPLPNTDAKPTTNNFKVSDISSLTNIGYTVYTALITQAGTAAPVATILQNTTGATFTWARTSGGTYTITASSNAFTSNKTLVFNNNGSSTGTFGFASAIWTRTSDTVVTITTGGDGRITNGSFEIRIYV
jgi:hypothetical protein